MPLPNLERDHGVHGFATLDRDGIVVDEGQMMRQPERYRFTLAHEIGHLELHRNLYDSGSVKSLASYLRFQEMLGDKEIDCLEFQARNFAGRILVPDKPLIELSTKAWESVRSKLPANFPLKSKCSAISRSVCGAFEVHLDVVETRLYGDRLSQKLGLGVRP
jgi:Zn-dependent peptidase ImmA (M78 family)